MAKRVPGKTVRSAVVGYRMGRLHAQYMSENADFELKAVCDIDPKRGKEVAENLPGVDFVPDLRKLLRRDDIDMVTIVLPHNIHCKTVCQSLRAGKHVVVEKPMAITTREADRMIEQAKASKRMLSVFHNRRLDGDYLAIRKIVRQGLIGDVFQVDIFGGGYHKPRKNWRSDQKVCGGALYDWGAHFVDWVLGLVPAQVVNVTGFTHKLVWREVSLEDQARAIVRFANGCVADITNSRIDMVGRERWRILGTKGGITLGPENTLKVRSLVKGHQAELSVPCEESRWPDYYANVADHLLRGKDLLVTGEEGRRVIAVIEAIAKSEQAQKSVPIRYP